MSTPSWLSNWGIFSQKKMPSAHTLPTGQPEGSLSRGDVVKSMIAVGGSKLTSAYLNWGTTSLDQPPILDL